MKALIDISVLLDVILERDPWVDAAVQAAAAIKIGAEQLVTRNEKDFRGLSLPVISPATALTLL